MSRLALIPFPAALAIYLVVLLVGVIVGVVAYRRLISLLAKDHPELYAELRQIRILNASPSKSIGFQRFIYSGRPEALGDDRVTRACRFLRWFTPVLVIIVLAATGLLCWSLVTVASVAGNAGGG